MQERYPHLFTDSGTPFCPCFLLTIVRGRTMGKLVSIVTTCLVVLSSRFYFWKKQAETTEPTTERHGHDGPSRVSRPKTLRNSEIWVLKSTL